MTNRRLLMLAIGAVLVVGGAGLRIYAAQQHKRQVQIGYAEPARGVNLTVGGFVSIAVGASLIVFAVLRPTSSKDE